MKNIHILPTDKPSEFYSIDGKHKLANSTMAMDWYISSAGYKPHNIYITSDEEIKEGINQWYLDKFINKPRNSSGSQYGEKQDVIILTTDQDLIKDGVQAIYDEFLEWFVKNPSCEEVKFKEIKDTDGKVVSYRFISALIPKEEPKQETLEEAAEDFYEENAHNITFLKLVEFGAKWQQEQDKNKYSEEEVLDIIKYYDIEFKLDTFSYTKPCSFRIEEWFEQFKKK
jgi:hypothetical protein